MTCLTDLLALVFLNTRETEGTEAAGPVKKKSWLLPRVLGARASKEQGWIKGHEMWAVHGRLKATGFEAGSHLWLKSFN